MISFLRWYSWHLCTALVLWPMNVLPRIWRMVLWLFNAQQERVSMPQNNRDSSEILSKDDVHLDTVQGDPIDQFDDHLELVQYAPAVQEKLHYGATSIVARLRPGVVIKYPRFSWWHSTETETHDLVEDIKHSFIVESHILRILGDSSRLVKFLDFSEDPRGLLFAEANGGNLQQYLDNHNDLIDMNLRMKWRTQAAEAIQYIHQKDVIHSDLRPEQFLLHTDDKGILNLCLSDFGGSTCGEINGGSLPDFGFFDPRKPWVTTKATDIFSLGSVFYTITTGHWPYKSPGPFVSGEEKQEYEEYVDGLFAQGQFPTVEDLPGGAIIYGCWTEIYEDADSVFHDQERLYEEFLGDAVESPKSCG